MAMMVDPEILERFAGVVGSVAGDISDMDVSTPFAESQNAFPGTDMFVICSEAHDASALALQNLCKRVIEVSEIATGSAKKYRVTEDDFVGMLHAMDLPQ
ncbi:MAG: hypothetical protein GX610_20100 [Rhodococcus sp.]|nr:hypothetical protein [Rhodococcus sp. (in: high G+C Gram-positive bacteria)]